MTLRIRTGFLIATLLVALPSLAHADCANPTGALGEIFYNGDFKIMQFCDGTDWIGMGGGSSGGAGVTDGDKGDISVSGSGASWLIDAGSVTSAKISDGTIAAIDIATDELDFSEFKDAMTLDASTSIAVTGSNELTLVNTGTGASFVVMDEASDTTPFIVAADGKVGVGIATPTQALDVVGKTTSNSFVLKPLGGMPAPTGGSGGSGNWSTDGTNVWRTAGSVGIGSASPAKKLHITADDPSAGIMIERTTSSNAPPVLVFRKSRSGGAVASGDLLLGMFASPIKDAGGSFEDMLFLRAVATENYTATATGYELAFFTTVNGTTAEQQRMVISNSGNVGIGTTNPNVRFHIDGGSDAELTNGTGFMVLGDMSAANMVIDANEIIARNNGVGANLYLQSSNADGNVVVGTAPSVTYKLEVASSSASYVARFTNTDATSATDGIIIQSGQASNPATGAQYVRFRDGDGDDIGSISGNGAGGVAYNTTSDRRIKSNIRDSERGVEDVMRLRVRDYTPNGTTTTNTGFIAQELVEVFPEVVSVPKNADEFWTVDYGRLTPLLTAAIQELKAANDNQAAEIEALRAEIEALKAAR